MKNIIVCVFIISIFVNCSHSNEEMKRSQNPAELTTTVQQDSTSQPQEPKGFKSPHQEHGEEYKDEKSKIN